MTNYIFYSAFSLLSVGSVCILSKAVSIAEHQGSPWLSQGHHSLAKPEPLLPGLSLAREGGFMKLSVWFVICKERSQYSIVWGAHYDGRVWAFLILSLSLLWRCWCVCCGQASVWSLVCWAGGWTSSHLTYKRRDWSLIQISGHPGPGHRVFRV